MERESIDRAVVIQQQIQDRMKELEREIEA